MGAVGSAQVSCSGFQWDIAMAISAPGSQLVVGRGKPLTQLSHTLAHRSSEVTRFLESLAPMDCVICL